MTSPVLAALASAKAAEEAEAERILTAKVWRHLGLAPPQGDKSHWPTWQAFCDQRKIAAFPALPAAVAMFVLNNAALGDRLEKVVESIGAVHEAEGKANPALSPIVTAALFPRGAPVEPPRSWDKTHRFMWQLLPRAIQQYIRDRENDRDRALRQHMEKLKKENTNGNSQQEPTPAAGTDRTDAGTD